MSDGREYQQRGLNRDELDPDPLRQFSTWFERALEVSPMPEAMCLSTVDASGAPDARMVLLKGVDSGFRFFTNYEGVKAAQIGTDPRAALVFHWVELDRQVRVRGAIEKLDPEESDDYFSSRGRSSRIGAWASPQSRPLEDGRESLEALQADVESRFEGVEDVPRPPHWGGFRLIPDQIEFWQGRESRLHDRFVCDRESTQPVSSPAWRVTRLAP